jgi:hypothetical protein
LYGEGRENETATWKFGTRLQRIAPELPYSDCPRILPEPRRCNEGPGIGRSLASGAKDNILRLRKRNLTVATTDATQSLRPPVRIVTEH